MDHGFACIVALELAVHSENQAGSANRGCDVDRVVAITLELRNSWLEALVFQTADQHLTYRVSDGPSHAIHYPAAGPYDWSLGYARMPVLLRLQSAGFHVQAQAEDSKLYSILADSGVYPIYRQKDPAGLAIATDGLCSSQRSHSGFMRHPLPFSNSGKFTSNIPAAGKFA